MDFHYLSRIFSLTMMCKNLFHKIIRRETLFTSPGNTHRIQNAWPPWLLLLGINRYKSIYCLISFIHRPSLIILLVPCFWCLSMPCLSRILEKWPFYASPYFCILNSVPLRPYLEKAYGVIGRYSTSFCSKEMWPESLPFYLGPLGKSFQGRQAGWKVRQRKFSRARCMVKDCSLQRILYLLVM